MREGRNTGQALVQLVTAPGESFETGYFVEVLRRFPEVRSIHWAINDTPAEVTNLPTRCSGARTRSRRSSAASASASARTRSCRRTRRWPSGSTGSRASTPALTGSETVYDLYCGIGTIGLALARRRAHGLGRRDLRGVGRVRARERRPERDHERGVLRRQRRPGRSRSCASARARRTSSSSTRRARASPARRCGGSGGSARRGSSTSRATRPRSPPTSKRCARTGATELVRARPVDMFPHTPHVETVALLDAAGELATVGSAAAGARLQASPPGSEARQSRSAFGDQEAEASSRQAGSAVARRPGSCSERHAERERASPAQVDAAPSREAVGSRRGRARRRAGRASPSFAARVDDLDALTSSEQVAARRTPDCCSLHAVVERSSASARAPPRSRSPRQGEAGRGRGSRGPRRARGRRRSRASQVAESRSRQRRVVALAPRPAQRATSHEVQREEEARARR